ncbi:MAG: glycoside hydrolase family 43 protein [Acidobacteria bacterium]|nr:glycoside hydrolase family 43 protein [Acidobacteriota bacterium]
MNREVVTTPNSTYLNPVYPHSFPDPFVLKVGNEFFAYCTGHWTDGNVFGVLHSPDLVSWTAVGGAMRPLATDVPFYWAPEVTYVGGKFYLYYSVGNETLMEIRVAESERPDCGFVDVGVRMTYEEFAIDPHVFIDSDGSRYMFYATDFLEHTHIGTGTVVDRMMDWHTLAGDPRPVTRAKYDWQVYDPRRKEKGDVRWHTVEGPFILERKNRYYEMFSGGNWQNTTYGVSFAKSDRVLRDDEWEQFADGEKVFPVLRTIPERIVGPGHNSVVRGPNNRELYCVYHRWIGTGRVLAIDRMDFAGERIFVFGASDTSQPAPLKPFIKGIFPDDPPQSGYWTVEGNWSFVNGTASCPGEQDNRLTLRSPSDSFLCEFFMTCINPQPDGGVGIVLSNGAEEALKLFFDFQNDQARLRLVGVENTSDSFVNLGEIRGTRHVRIDANLRRIKIMIDGPAVRSMIQLNQPASDITLEARNCFTFISGFALTGGFEELFDNGLAVNDLGFLVSAGSTEINADSIRLVAMKSDVAVLSRTVQAAEFEVAANVRLEDAFVKGELGIRISGAETNLESAVDLATKTIRLDANGELVRIPLENDFDASQYFQLRIMSVRNIAIFYLNGIELARLRTKTTGIDNISVFACNCAILVEMVRFTNAQ